MKGRKPKAHKKEIKTLSLFTGAGGLDIGFHQAGFGIVACVEIDANYCKTLEANRGVGKAFRADTGIIHGDVGKFKADKFAKQIVPSKTPSVLDDVDVEFPPLMKRQSAMPARR